MEKRDLETIIVVGIIFVILTSVYKAGKREGSRKGYGVGFDRGRRSKNGCCLLVIATTAIGILATAAALACAVFQR